jgi:hypothetical protein
MLRTFTIGSLLLLGVQCNAKKNGEGKPSNQHYNKEQNIQHLGGSFLRYIWRIFSAFLWSRCTTLCAGALESQNDSEEIDGGRRLRRRQAPLSTVCAYSGGSVTLIASVDEHQHTGYDNSYEEDAAHLEHHPESHYESESCEREATFT